MLRVRTLVTGVAGSPWYVNTYHQGDGQEAAEISAGDMRSFWISLSSSLVTGLSYQVQSDVALVDEESGEIGTYYIAPQSAVGSSGEGTPLPFANQGLIRLNTSSVILGRRVQGRLLVPGALGFLSTPSGTPSAQFLTTLNSAAAALMHGGAVGSIGVWARPKYASPVAGVPPTLLLPGSFHVATSLAAQPKWAVLRSRRD